MDVTGRLSPAMKGTKRYLSQFGSQLLYVRYRKDVQQQKRFTTVELIVAEQPLIPQFNLSRKHILPDTNHRVLVQVDYPETELRQQLKAMGANWLQDRRRWKMRRYQAIKLGLEARIEKI